VTDGRTGALKGYQLSSSSIKVERMNLKHAIQLVQRARHVKKNEREREPCSPKAWLLIALAVPV
jgi:ribosomal protein L21E